MHNIQPFNMEGADLYGEWKKWLSSFEYTMLAAGIKTQEKKMANLMSLAGPAIDDVYQHAEKDVKERSLEDIYAMREDIECLDDTPIEAPVYDNCIIRLNKYFDGYFDSHAATREFRGTKQHNDEPFSAYLIRLKKAASQCKFDDPAKRDEEIIYQISEGAKFSEVGNKAFEWKEKPLCEIEKFGRMFEAREKKNSSRKPGFNNQSSSSEAVEVAPIVKTDSGKFEGRSYANASRPYGQAHRYRGQQRYAPYQTSRGGFNASYQRGRGRGKSMFQRGNNREECIRCGSWSHYGNSPECPAKDKKCGDGGKGGGCGKIGHFAHKCQTFQAYVKTKQAEQINQLEEYDDEV